MAPGSAQVILVEKALDTFLHRSARIYDLDVTVADNTFDNIPKEGIVRASEYDHIGSRRHNRIQNLPHAAFSLGSAFFIRLDGLDPAAPYSLDDTFAATIP